MKLSAIRSASAVLLLSLLTACGGSGFEAGAPAPQAAAPDRASIEAPVASDGLAAAAAVQTHDSDGIPTPDCQPENCQGLRIIDGNAEAFRFGAIRGSAATDDSSS